jgi:hypothetical protein
MITWRCQKKKKMAGGSFQPFPPLLGLTPKQDKTKKRAPTKALVAVKQG